MKKNVKAPCLLLLVLALTVGVFVGNVCAKYMTTTHLDLLSLSIIASDEVTSDVVSLRVVDMPSTTVYSVGDSFSTSGMTVLAQYADGTQEYITNYSVCNGTALTIDQSFVIIEYGGCTTTVPIEVGYCIIYSANGGSYENGAAKNQVLYNAGAGVQTTVVSKTKNLDDAGNEIVSGGYGYEYTMVDTVTIPGASLLTVTVTYAIETEYDWLAIYDGTVVPTANNYEKSVSGRLWSESVVTKTFTVTGDTVQFFFSSDDVECNYYGYYAVVTGDTLLSTAISGEEEIPTREGYSFTGWYYDANVTSEFELGCLTDNIVVYAGWDARAFTGLAILAQPDVTEYELGDDFDSSGMVVAAMYADGGMSVVTNYSLLDATDLSAGQTVVLVSYTDPVSGVTATIKVPISVVYLQAIYTEVTSVVSTTVYKELLFVKTAQLSAGDLYGGRTVVDVFTGFDDTVYSCASDVPWHDYVLDIEYVRFHTNVAPISTAYWFSGMENCGKVNLQNLDMSHTTNATSMFDGCSSLKRIDFRKLNIDSLVETDNMFRDCISIVDAYAIDDEMVFVLNETSNRAEICEFIVFPGVYGTPEEYDREVSDWVLYYINQYRLADGVNELEKLDGMTLVAEYRADQLITNYAHSQSDKNEAYTYLEYGDLVDMSSSYDDDHYACYAQEAIGKGYSYEDDPAIVGEAIATSWYNSPGHWAYVGSADYAYGAVGVEFIYDAESDIYIGYACIMVNDIDYG